MSKSQRRKRTKGMTVAFTPEEYAELLEKAAATDLSSSGFLRASGLVRVIPRTKAQFPVDRQMLERAISEMRRIGNNINQIAHAANMNQTIDLAVLSVALQEYTDTLKLLREARKA